MTTPILIYGLLVYSLVAFALYSIYIWYIILRNEKRRISKKEKPTQTEHNYPHQSSLNYDGTERRSAEITPRDMYQEGQDMSSLFLSRNWIMWTTEKGWSSGPASGTFE